MHFFENPVGHHLKIIASLKGIDYLMNLPKLITLQVNYALIQLFFNLRNFCELVQPMPNYACSPKCLQTLQILEVHPVPCSNTCHLYHFSLFFLLVVSRSSFTSGTSRR